MIRGFDIICISTSNWDRPWGSRQEIMLRLSSSNRILYVEYQMSLLHPMRYLGLAKRLLRPPLKILNENLILFRPMVNLPFGHYSCGINLINQVILLFQLKRLIKRLNFQRPLLWVFAPNACYLVGKLGEQLSIYHCIDSFKDEKANFLRRRTIGIMEESLTKRCNLIFASSAPIYLGKKRLNKNTFISPSAVSEELIFEDIASRDCPKDLRHIPHPRIGLAGTLDNRIDLDLIEALAGRNRQWSFVFIGEAIANVIHRLRRHPNIYLLGFKERTALNSYLHNLDVCLIPYKVDNFTNKISPIKLYEYLAAGKPVVSTALDSLNPFFNTIKIAEGPEDFEAKIREVLLQDQGLEIPKRIELARDNTWRIRVEEMSRLIIGNYVN